MDTEECHVIREHLFSIFHRKWTSRKWTYNGTTAST